MYILIFEPHKGCRKVLLDKRAEKINLGRSLRDGYGNIQMSTDFLPDYVGVIIYKDDKFYFRNYGKIKIFVNNNQLNDSTTAVRLTHGSMIRIEHGISSGVYIGVVDGEIENKWKIFNPEEHRFLNVQKDRRGYIIRNTENIIYKGKKINTDYFIPRNGDIFINQNYIFCCLKNNLFFEKIKNTVSQEHVKFINNTSVENNIKNK